MDEILTRLSAQSWGQRDIFGVHLALEEALVNAIKHGNGWDASKSVHVCCRLSLRRLLIEIRDEGTGFNPDNVPDCRDPDHLEVPSGRGVLLMRSFMSSVEYNCQGNCVVMTKDRDAEDAA